MVVYNQYCTVADSTMWHLVCLNSVNLTNKHQNMSKDLKMYTWFTQCYILINSEDQEKICLWRKYKESYI